jgi:hypothetical protein
MRLRRPKLTYANAIATLALFLALGGAAYAGTQLPKNSVGSNQLKKNAVTTAKIKNGAVTGSKVNLSTLGTVPNATHAASADNSTQLGGKGPSNYVQQVAQSGETLTGQISEHYAPGEEFWLAGGSYRSPLPASAPVPNLVFLEEGETSAPGCPGLGKANAGFLCVYGYNTNNLETVGESGNFHDPNYHYGFSLDLIPDVLGEEGYLIATWAYQVP